jgi:hypothetical protein
VRARPPAGKKVTWVKVLDSALARRVRRSPALRPPAIMAYRVMDRLTPAAPGPRVVANSMPKSGTHLLASLLDQLEGMRFAGHLVVFDPGDRFNPQPPLRHLETRLRKLRDSHYIGGHLIHEPEVERRIGDSGAKLITILRDPRAVIVSGAHYVMDAKHLRDRAEALEMFPDLPSVLRALVFGHGEPGDKFYSPEIGERYRAYADWVGASVGITVRFEDLVGSRGGGSDAAQIEGVASVLTYLGYGSRNEPSEQIAERMFSEKSITFRAGTIDSWRADLPQDLAQEIETRCADSMRRLGYKT